MLQELLGRAAAGGGGGPHPAPAEHAAYHVLAVHGHTVANVERVLHKQEHDRVDQHQ